MRPGVARVGMLVQSQAGNGMGFSRAWAGLNWFSKGQCLGDSKTDWIREERRLRSSVS